MSRDLIEPESEIFPNRYRWRVEACYRLMDLGFLEGRFEILDGEVISKVGQKPPHRIAIILLVKWLHSLFDALHVQSEGPITLPVPDGVYSEPEPDIVVTREPTTVYVNRHPGPEDLLFVMEVSDTTLRTDLLVKARLYARAGIAEYWVLDLNARQIHVHREPADGEYRVVTLHAEGESIALAVRPNAPIAIANLLPPIAEAAT